MQSKIGISRKQSPAEAVAEAVSGISNPLGIIFTTTDYNGLEETAKELTDRFPDAEIIGTSGTCYAGETISEKNLLVITAITGQAVVSCGVIKHLATAPLSDLDNLQDSITKVKPGNKDTVCFEFCTNDEEQFVTTMNIETDKRGIGLIGGTVYGVPAGQKSKVVCRKRVLTNAAAYMVIKNTSGKAYVFRENIYERDENAIPHVATKVDLKEKRLIELDGRPAAEVYSSETGISRNEIVNNVLDRPLGRAVANDVYISSPYEVSSDGSIKCYKRLNEDDTVYILRQLDYRQVNDDTRHMIKSTVPSPSLVLSVNCIYRYMLFNQQGFMPEFLKNMGALGPHAGYIGGGEQYNHQHVNQTMVCAVFE